MSTDLSQETVDDLVDALASDDKERAILLSYRASGEDLAAAWSRVRQIVLDLGGREEDQPARAAADPAFRNVKYYLETPASARRKAILRSAVIAAALLGVATYVLVDHSTRLFLALQSFSWPQAEATVVKARTYSIGRLEQNRETSTDYMDFTYRYEVDGKEYTGSRARVAYYEVFGGKAFEVGDRFKVPYNPKSPGETIYDRQIYSRIFAIVVGLVLLGIGALVITVEGSRESNRRRLRRLDDGEGG